MLKTFLRLEGRVNALLLTRTLHTCVWFVLGVALITLASLWSQDIIGWLVTALTTKHVRHEAPLCLWSTSPWPRCLHNNHRYSENVHFLYLTVRYLGSLWSHKKCSPNVRRYETFMSIYQSRSQSREHVIRERTCFFVHQLCTDMLTAPCITVTMRERYKQVSDLRVSENNSTSWQQQKLLSQIPN